MLQGALSVRDEMCAITVISWDIPSADLRTALIGAGTPQDKLRWDRLETHLVTHIVMNITRLNQFGEIKAGCN